MALTICKLSDYEMDLAMLMVANDVFRTKETHH